jgi:hypothetical protein
MSIVYDLQPPGLGGIHYGGSGLGVLGSEVPSTGTHGPAALYNLLTPAEASKEVRFFLDTVPPSGLFSMDENSAFTWAASNGVYTFSGYWYIDGVGQSLVTDTIIVGSAGLIVTTPPTLTLTGDTAVLVASVPGLVNTIPAILSISKPAATVLGQEYVFRMPWTGADVTPKDRPSNRKVQKRQPVERIKIELEEAAQTKEKKKFTFVLAPAPALISQFNLIKALRSK